MKISYPARAGFTLPELLTTIAVLGILCGLAIASYTGLHHAAREAVARDTNALLNRAVLLYNQANAEIGTPAAPGAATDELAVLAQLQARDPNPPDPQKSLPPTEYLSANFPRATSSSEEDFRIQWNGHMFEIIPLGTAGVGLITGAASP